MIQRFGNEDAVSSRRIGCRGAARLGAKRGYDKLQDNAESPGGCREKCENGRERKYNGMRRQWRQRQRAAVLEQGGCAADVGRGGSAGPESLHHRRSRCSCRRASAPSPWAARSPGLCRGGGGRLWRRRRLWRARASPGRLRWRFIASDASPARAIYMPFIKLIIDMNL